MRFRIRIALSVTALALGLLAGAAAAWADPIGSKNSFSFTATCGSSTVELVVNSANGRGAGSQEQDTAPFAPAHVVGTNEVFHPTVFDLVFSFAPAGGTTESFVDTDSMRNPKTPVSCDIDTSQTDDQGNTFAIQGTVWGFFS